MMLMYVGLVSVELNLPIHHHGICLLLNRLSNGLSWALVVLPIGKFSFVQYLHGLQRLQMLVLLLLGLLHCLLWQVVDT